MTGDCSQISLPCFIHVRFFSLYCLFVRFLRFPSRFSRFFQSSLLSHFFFISSWFLIHSASFFLPSYVVSLLLFPSVSVSMFLLGSLKWLRNQLPNLLPAVRKCFVKHENEIFDTIAILPLEKLVEYSSFCFLLCFFTCYPAFCLFSDWQ